MRFEGRIDVMLPDHSELRDTFSFLREINVADKILVTLSMRDGSVTPDTLIAAVGTYQAALDPMLATPMHTSFQTETITADFIRLARQMPDYVTPVDFAQLDADTSGAGIRTSLESLKRRVQQPEGIFAASAARSDPLDWNGRTVQKILAAVTAFGYRVMPVDGHLMDPERRHLLLVLSTPVAMMDANGVRQLMTHLQTCAAALPPTVEAHLVCGHLHTAGNEAVIRRDITVTAIAVTLVFIFLFLGIYRDWRAGFVVLIPFLASVPALALAASRFDSFSFMVVGFGSVIAGIAIDYGIHTYVAARGEQRERTLRLIRRPVTLSMLTTLCVFVAFCFSSIPAYRQLGVFAAITIIISLGYALWALPLFVKKMPLQVAIPFTVIAPSRRRTWLVLALGCAIFVTGCWLLSRLHFDTDVSKLDGTPQATLDEEKRAMSIWGGGESLAAILCVDAPDEATALRLNDALYTGLLAAGIDSADISSLAPVWPSDETRRQRRRAWAAYWTDERVQALQSTLASVASELDFSEHAFDSFWNLFAGWRDLPASQGVIEPVGFLQSLHERFVHPQEGGVTRVTTFVPDEPRFLAAAQSLHETISPLRVISRRAFSQALSETFSHEVLRISLLAALLILIVTGAIVRHAGMVLLAAVPAVIGLVWGGAAMALCGLPLNTSNLIAGIIVLGLCIDYGICMVYAHRRGLRRDVFRAVTLSATTTVLGAAALLLARHPAFFSIGVTLVAGVAAGYLSAWLLLPALQTVWPRLNPPQDDPRKEEKT